MQTFRLVEKTLEPGCYEIQVEGEIDLAVADQLKEALERAGLEHDLILIGLQRCNFIDSTAIAVIIQAYRQRAEQGQRVAIHGPSAQVRRVLSVTGLLGNGLVFDRAEEALEVSA